MVSHTFMYVRTRATTEPETINGRQRIAIGHAGQPDLEEVRAFRKHTVKR